MSSTDGVPKSLLSFLSGIGLSLLDSTSRGPNLSSQLVIFVKDSGDCSAKSALRSMSVMKVIVSVHIIT